MPIGLSLWCRCCHIVLSGHLSSRLVHLSSRRAIGPPILISSKISIGTNKIAHLIGLKLHWLRRHELWLWIVELIGLIAILHIVGIAWMVRHCGHCRLKAHFGLPTISLLELEFVLHIALIWVLILVVQECMMGSTTFATAFCLAL